LSSPCRPPYPDRDSLAHQLSLLKIDGRWQIAQKVFMTELRD
jgi:hypothetical protein